MRTRSTLVRAAVLAAAMAFISGAAVACSPSSDNESVAEHSPDGAFPVTIEHARGSTTIESAPEQIVTIGYTDHEPLLALGVIPVGVAEWWGSGLDASWPWVADKWNGHTPEYVTNGETTNYEQIASLEPDLILALYADLDDEAYNRLSQIAPTVAQSDDYDAYTTPWTEMTVTAGRAIGKENEAKQLVDATEDAFAAVRASHPEFAGKTATVVNLDTPEGYVFASGDPRGVFMSSLGFTPSTELDDYIGAEFGTWLSDERFDLIDLDRILVMADTDGAKLLQDNALYQRLNVVKEGRATIVPYTEEPAIGAAMSYNTVLSIPYAIDQATKRLTSK